MKISHGSVAALLGCCLAFPVLGQTEKITLYADAAGTDCSITDIGPGVVAVHMIHIGSGRRGGDHFIAPMPACWTGAVWLGDAISPGFLFIGSTQTNFTVAEAGVPCGHTPLPRYIGKMNFFGMGTGQPCCEYPVLPAPTAEIPGSVITVDCDPPPFGSLLAIGGGKVTINENENCPCNPPLAVEETTWGRVKAFYR